MNSDLADLQITDRELETLTGLDISDVFVGGVFGGVYRASVFQHKKRLLIFCLTEAIVAVLIFVFSLPVGLWLTRNSTAGVQGSSAIFQFLQITLGLTAIVVLAWNLYMRAGAKRLKTLMHLLDEVDRYNEVIQAVDLIDRLEAIGHTKIARLNRQEVLEALRLTRDNLTTGLRTEKVLRDNQKLFARRYELIENIDRNLTSLRTLELHDQANEYGKLLNEALQISLAVQQEIGQITRDR